MHPELSAFATVYYWVAWVHNIDLSYANYFYSQNKEEDIYGGLDAFYEPASNENDIYSQLQSCGVKSIPHSQIR